MGWESTGPKRRRAGVGVIAALGMLAFVAAACAEDSRTVPIFDPSYREQTRELSVGVGSCRADLEAEVVETAAEVRVTVTATGGLAEDCADGLTLQLDEPLDGRQVVDGASGQALEVTLDR